MKKQKEIGIKVFPTLSQYRDFVRYFFHEMYIAIIWKDYTWVTPIGTFYINGRKRPKGLVPLKNYFNEATGSWEVRKTISKVSSRKMYKMKWDISDVRGVYFKFYKFKLTRGKGDARGYYLGSAGLSKRIKDAAENWRINFPLSK